MRSDARTIRARYREIEKMPTELSSLNWVMERTNLLDTFPDSMQAVSNAYKLLKFISFPLVHTKQSHAILELGSGAAINNYVIKK